MNLNRRTQPCTFVCNMIQYFESHVSIPFNGGLIALDEYNQKADRPEPWESSDPSPAAPPPPEPPVPVVPPETSVVLEPWMSLHPSVTPEQWQAYRVRMSPLEWETYCGKWRAYYRASQSSPASPYTPPVQPYSQFHGTQPYATQPYAAPYGQPYNTQGYTSPYGQPYTPQPYVQPVYQPKPSKAKPVFRAIWPPIAYIGSQFVAGFILVIIIIFTMMGSMDFGSGALDDTLIEEATAQSVELVFYISVALQVAFIPIFLACFLRDRRKAAEAGVLPSDRPSAPPLAVMGIFAAAGLFFVISSLLIMLDNVLPDSLTQQYEEMMNQITRDMGLWAFISTVILAPIVEELALRGLVQRRLRVVMPEWGALVVSAAIFGIMHMNIIQSTYAFALGLFLGWIYQRGKNILIPILGHLAFNGMNYFLGFLFGFFEENPNILGAEATRNIVEQTPLYAGISAGIGLLLAAAMLLLYWRFSRKREDIA